MPEKHIFTIEEDNEIIRRRLLHQSFETIAKEVGLSRNSIIGRARKIGAKLAEKQTEIDDAMVTRNNDPLPAGHDKTWKAITDGTILQGLRYPNNNRL